MKIVIALPGLGIEVHSHSRGVNQVAEAAAQIGGKVIITTGKFENGVYLIKLFFR